MVWARLRGRSVGSRQTEYRVVVCRQAGRQAGRREGEVWMGSARGDGNDGGRGCVKVVVTSGGLDRIGWKMGWASWVQGGLCDQSRPVSYAW